MIIPALSSTELASKAIRGSRGEFIVLRRLAEIAKDNGWLVLRNFRLEEHQSKVESEIDVVIFAGSCGICLLEVKGSSLRVRDGQWSTFNRGKSTWDEIQNPLEQIKDNSFQFASVTKELMRSFRSNPLISWGVVFPENDSILGTVGYPSWRICNASGLDQLETFILTLAKKTRSKLSALDRRMVGGLDLRTAHTIVEHLIPVQIEAMEISHDFNSSLNELELESRRVKGLIDSTMSLAFCLVEGAAGTGKTRAAMHYCNKYISVGKTVAFFCSSRSFARHVGRILDGMYPGHGIVWCSQQGHEVPDLMDVDCLVVDEIQDLAGSQIFRKALLAANSLDIPIRAFGDFMGQNLFDSKAEFLDWLESQSMVYIPLFLDKNCRNTASIGRALKSFFPSEKSSLSFSSIEGERIEVLPPTPRVQLGSVIASAIDGWVSKGNPIGGVTVLYTVDGDGSELGEGNLSAFGGKPMLELDLPREFSIPVSSIMNFKGLEAPCIVLVLDSFDESMNKAIYIALSRARLKVFVVLTDEVDFTNLNNWLWKIAGKK